LFDIARQITRSAQRAHFKAARGCAQELLFAIVKVALQVIGHVQPQPAVAILNNVALPRGLFFGLFNPAQWEE